jgi:hypothetical protein
MITWMGAELCCDAGIDDSVHDHKCEFCGFWVGSRWYEGACCDTQYQKLNEQVAKVKEVKAEIGPWQVNV